MASVLGLASDCLLGTFSALIVDEQVPMRRRICSKNHILFVRGMVLLGENYVSPFLFHITDTVTPYNIFRQVVAISRRRFNFC